MTQTLRRLIDLPGVSDLESKALMKPGYADPSRRDEFPEVDEVLTTIFGLTAEQAEDAARPDDWDGIERLSPQDQADLFDTEGRTPRRGAAFGRSTVCFELSSSAPVDAPRPHHWNARRRRCCQG